MKTSSSGLRGQQLIAVLLLGFAVLVAVAGLALKGVGLQNTPTSTVDGKNVVGRTGN